MARSPESRPSLRACVVDVKLPPICFSILNHSVASLVLTPAEKELRDDSCNVGREEVPVTMEGATVVIMMAVMVTEEEQGAAAVEEDALHKKLVDATRLIPNFAHPTPESSF